MAFEGEFEEATERGFRDLRTHPRALSAWYDQASNKIVVELNTGYAIAFPPARSQPLVNATPEELAEIEIDYPGFSLYFPRLDDGLLVSSLTQGRFGNDRWEAAWLAAHPLESRPFPEAFGAPTVRESTERTTEAA